MGNFRDPRKGLFYPRYKFKEHFLHCFVLYFQAVDGPQ